jgi:N-acetylmuramoyl-L-alanine amidase
MAIFVTAGHNNFDPGAISNGFREADITKRFRNKAISFIDQTKYKVHVDQDDWNLTKTINELVTGPASACADIHCNADAKGIASGVEVFVPERATELELKYASLICVDFSKIMGIPNRGVKRPSSSQHKTLGILSEEGINMLVELFFISNLKNIEAYFKHEEALAKTFAARMMQADDEIK